MNLAKELEQLAEPKLSLNEQTRLRCQLAGHLEEAGNYEAARKAMGDIWHGVGQSPNLDGLDVQTCAAVLLRVGALTRDIGSAGQIEGAQENAKNLLTESISLYESLEMSNGVVEAQIEIAVCYRREGAFDEARVMLQQALGKLDESASDLRAIALLRSAIVEWSAKRFHDALRILTEVAPLFEASNNSVIKGKLHHGFGFVLKALGGAEGRQDYIDRALIEYAAASFYFEEAGLTRYAGCVENNLGFLFGIIGKFVEAHEHLDRAQVFFTTLNDTVNLAQADETRARVLLLEGQTVASEKVIRRAVRILEKGGEQSLLAEALTTQGTAFARLRDLDRAEATLQRATEIAEQAGDSEGAGQAALVMIEELGAYLSNDKLNVAVNRAGKLLKNTQEISTLRRLVTSACGVVSHLYTKPNLPPSVDWTNFSVEGEWLRYEGHFIKLALQDSAGRVTKAAHLLGMSGHQSLQFALNSRHQDLLLDRTPIVPRKRSLTKERNRDHAEHLPRKASKAVRILHVEDDSVVANIMNETLALEGWEVEICADGIAAMVKIISHTHYDLLLLDYDLPGVNGVQLVQQTRKLAHRATIPIIILSATLDETAAREAGADASLRKPQDISAVAETVTRLLRSAKA